MHSSTTGVGIGRAILVSTLLVAVLGLSGCISPPLTSVPQMESTPLTPVPLTALPGLTGDPLTAAIALITLENRGAHTRDRALLSALWTADAVVIDGRNTATAVDDYRWSGHSAVMDRYAVAVFPTAPPLLSASPAPELRSSTWERAHLVNGGDQWVIVKRDGRWYLHELAYQQPQ